MTEAEGMEDDAMGKHDPPKDPSKDDGQWPGPPPKEPDPGKHEKK